MTYLPSDRIRVFVSSRLGECEAERASARETIELLGHQPVMFEGAGARAHAPRPVYLRGLEESQIFVGIYREGYGISRTTWKFRDWKTNIGLQSLRVFLNSYTCFVTERWSLKCVHFDTRISRTPGRVRILATTRETNRCGSALIRSMKALQASKRWRMRHDRNCASPLRASTSRDLQSDSGLGYNLQSDHREAQFRSRRLYTLGLVPRAPSQMSTTSPGSSPIQAATWCKNSIVWAWLQEPSFQMKHWPQEKS